MKKESYIIWGIVLVIVGLLLSLNAVGLTNINILFPGWWTLLIIIPSCIGIYKDKNKLPSLVCLIIGVILLLASLNIFSFDIVLKLIIPVMIFVIGIRLILNGIILKPINDKIRVDSRVRKRSDYVSTFSSLFYEHNGFLDSSNVKNVFGNINVDYKKCELEEDAVITINSAFGNSRISLPDNVKVIIKTSSVLGTINNNHKNSDKSDKVIYVYANAIFGSINIE